MWAKTILQLLPVTRVWMATASVAAIEPTEIYDGGFNSTSPIVLRIGSGTAGQSDLIKVLADAFIQESVKNGSAPFRMGWIISDMTSSIRNLQTGDADLGITYNPAAEQIAARKGVIDPRTYYVFRDHFLIVGPSENPANVEPDADVFSIMGSIFQAADQVSNSDMPVRWLSRFDKSATNIKESQLWLGIGQVPWASAYSTWYHQHIAFPLEALRASVLLKEYTLTDRGTFLSMDPAVMGQTVVYKAGSDDESDVLLNPAHLLVGMKAQNSSLAYEFAEWAVGNRGQSVITQFRKNGQQVYSGAP